MSMEVMAGNFGVVDVDADEREFDLVEFTSLPHEHSKSTSAETGQIFELQDGEKVVDVMFWTKLEKSGGRWCVPGMQRGVARMSNTVDASLVFKKYQKKTNSQRGIHRGSHHCRTQKQKRQNKLTSS